MAINYRPAAYADRIPKLVAADVDAARPHCRKFEAAKCKYLAEDDGDDGRAPMRTFDFLICNLDVSFLKLEQIGIRDVTIVLRRYTLPI